MRYPLLTITLICPHSNFLMHWLLGTKIHWKEFLHACCGGCGEVTSIETALDCKPHTWVWLYKGKVRWDTDRVRYVPALAYCKVLREPIIRKADPTEGVSGLIADLVIWGLWQPQTEVLLDDVQSHCHHSVEVILATAEEKREKVFRCSRGNASFLLSIRCNCGWSIGSWGK